MQTINVWKILATDFGSKHQLFFLYCYFNIDDQQHLWQAKYRLQAEIKYIKLEQRSKFVNLGGRHIN